MPIDIDKKYVGIVIFRKFATELWSLIDFTFSSTLNILWTNWWNFTISICNDIGII